MAQYSPEQLDKLRQAIDPNLLMYVRGGGRMLIRAVEWLEALLAEQEVAKPVAASAPTRRTVHTGVTKVVRGRPVWTGNLTTSPDGDWMWTWPLKWEGVENPALGPKRPNLIFVVVTGDLFVAGRPTKDIDRVCATIAQSDHIGLLVSKYTPEMAAYFSSLDPRTVRRWKPKMRLCFSAERQREFDQRWADIRPLAESGWFVFTSLAPLIVPVTLPQDFLELGRWVIVNGEEAPRDRCRPMDANWARAIRDQCTVAGIPFFMRGMHTGAYIPPDLRIHQFPSADLF
jgi:protein gp37